MKHNFDFRGTTPKRDALASRATTMVDDGRVLIFTGPSGFGSHSARKHMQCPHRFALSHGTGPELLQGVPAATDAAAQQQQVLHLVQELPRGPDSGGSIYVKRGTIVHVGISHFYARLGCRQGGVVVDGKHYTDESVFYEPEQAADLGAQRIEDGHQVLGTAVSILRKYLAWAKVRDTDPRVVSVETVYRLQLPSGHVHTARLDLVTQNAAGIARFVDHKTLSQPEHPGKKFQHDLQILGHKAIGRSIYGRAFDGVWINSIDAAESSRAFKVYRERVPTVPALERETVNIIDRERTAISDKVRRGVPPHQWERRPGKHCDRCSVRQGCVYGT